VAGVVRQRLLTTAIYDGDHVQVGYPSNYAKGDFLLHFPDMPNDKRLEAMRYWAQFAVS